MHYVYTLTETNFHFSELSCHFFPSQVKDLGKDMEGKRATIKSFIRRTVRFKIVEHTRISNRLMTVPLNKINSFTLVI